MWGGGFGSGVRVAPSVLLAVCLVRDLQDAVVLADCFPQRFSPVALTRPKVLLPLVNVPLLDYTLEWLASQCTDVRSRGGAVGSCVRMAAVLLLKAPSSRVLG